MTSFSEPTEMRSELVSSDIVELASHIDVLFKMTCLEPVSSSTLG